MRIDATTIKGSLFATAFALFGAVLLAAEGRSEPAILQTAEATAGDEPVVNPHWSAQGCAVCHEVVDGRAMPIGADDVDGVCLQCHDGKRATAERHPVGRAFDGDRVVKPEGWPAPNNVIGCVTCHDVRSACEDQDPKPTFNSVFLRERGSGPALEFCAKCHQRSEAHGLHNPHVMLTDEHKPIQRSCLFCHKTSIASGAQQTRTGKSRLQSDELTLCLGCHRRHLDYFEPGHVGAAVSEEVANMISGSAGVDGKRGIVMPLSAGNRITCSTCHNPHQLGVFPEGSQLEFGGISFGTTRRGVALRQSTKELCIACHQK